MTRASILRFSLIAFGSLVGCVILGLIVSIWLRSVPSADSRQLLARHAGRQIIPDAGNANVYLWGLVAPAEVDPAALGSRRIAWLRLRYDDPENDTPDPAGEPIEARELRSPALDALNDLCSNAVAAPCTTAFDAAVASALATPDELRVLARYRTLLAYPGYSENVPFDDTMPLPPFSYAYDGQRLQFIELARAADRADAAAVRDGLERGAEFWRRVQHGADGLIPKMYAASALRNEFFFGNRILRRLPVAALSGAIPPSWRRAFDADELSMARVLAGEFAFANRVAHRRERDLVATYTADDDQEYETPGALDRVLAGLGRRLNPAQSYLNRIATVYLAVGRDFSGPLHDYDAIASRLRTELPDYKSLKIEDYVFRVATVEGQRRAALLAAELRAGALPRDGVGAAVRSHALSDPFTREPFAWNEVDGTLTFQGPKANGRRRTQTYLY